MRGGYAGWKYKAYQPDLIPEYILTVSSMELFHSDILMKKDMVLTCRVHLRCEVLGKTTTKEPTPNLLQTTPYAEEYIILFLSSLSTWNYVNT